MDTNFKKYEYKNIFFDLDSTNGAILITKENFEKLAKFVDVDCKIIDLFELTPISLKKEARKCPHCGEIMEQIFCDGVFLDRCQKCNLLWFDNGELSKYFNVFSKKQMEIVSNTYFIKKYIDNGIAQNNSLKNRKEEYKKRGNIQMQSKETDRPVPAFSGWFILLINILLYLFAILSFIFAATTGFILAIIGCVILFFAGVFLSSGYCIVQPQVARVYTMFGKYYGTLNTEGFYWVNPLAATHHEIISLKVRTLENPKQKINDMHGNPIEVGIMVTWEVINSAKAVFNVNSYSAFLSSQCDSSLRNIVRLYPYDAPEEAGVQSLKDDSEEISEKLKNRIQECVSIAGINIIDARITHLAYSEEIAVAMLQRQQANAVIDARRAIVDGAVSMVEMAIEKLSQNKNIVLDDKTKASMVNNLLVILCGNKDSQPVIRNDVL